MNGLPIRKIAEVLLWSGGPYHATGYASFASSHYLRWRGLAAASGGLRTNGAPAGSGERVLEEAVTFQPKSLQKGLC